MTVFFDYIRNIQYYLVFMALVGVMAPNGKYKKYIALVMGLALVGLVLSPLTGFLQGAPLPAPAIFSLSEPFAPHEALVTGSFWEDGPLRDAFHGQLTAQTTALLSHHGYTLLDARWETTPDFSHVTAVWLTVAPGDAPPTRRPFIHVAPVRIAPYQPAPPETTEHMHIKNWLADFYTMSAGHIHVRMVTQ